MSTEPPNLAEILMVEDSHVDVLMTREAFEQARLFNKLHVVEDGVKAMQFLRQEAEFASSPRPDLILLDLNLPRKDGREVLAEIKADPDLVGSLRGQDRGKDLALVLAAVGALLSTLVVLVDWPPLAAAQFVACEQGFLRNQRQLGIQFLECCRTATVHFGAGEFC